MSAPKGHGLTVAFGLGEPDHMTHADGEEHDGSASEEERDAGADLSAAIKSGDGESIFLACKHIWDLLEGDEKETGEPASKEY